MNNKSLPTLLVSVISVFLDACSIAMDRENFPNSMPIDWLVEIPDKPDFCPSIDGYFEVIGTGKVSQSATLVQTRLDAALGYTFPSDRIPVRVGIFFDSHTSLLNLEFGEPINQIFSEPVICLDAWYQLEQKQTDEYVGDGTNLDYETRKIELSKSVDGNLIVHLQLEAQFSSFVLFRSHEKREIWSMYERSLEIQ